MSLHAPHSAPDEPLPPGDGRVLLDAALLKRLRKDRALSQEALAELCLHQQLNVSIASLKRAEAGKAVLYRTARHLAQLFHVSLTQLIAPMTPGAPAAPHIAASRAAHDATRSATRSATQAAAAPASMPALSALSATGAGSLPPAIELAEHIVRYVFQLHIFLSVPADAACQADIAAQVRQFGGQRETTDGNLVLASFGLPQAYRSDAERALRCAIALSRSLLAHGGRAMALCLVRWQDGRAGHAEHTPPDLRRAEPGAGARTQRLPILVADNVASQLAPGHFVFAGGAPRHAGYRSFSQLAPAALAQLPALIGRHAETAQFKALLEATQYGHTGHLLYLRAMAGMGKSRLAHEFTDIAQQNGLRCHACSIEDTGAAGWRAPLLQLVRSLFGLDNGDHNGDGDGQTIAATIALLQLPPETALFYRTLAGLRLVPAQAALFSAMSHEVRERGMAQALQLLLLRLAAIDPLLITLEDIHWGDPVLYEALGPLLALSREAPIMWVITSRIEHDPLESQLRPQLFDLALTVFDLAPMAGRDAALLADQFSDVAPAYRQRCLQRAQGNPLFLTQLLASPEHDLPDSLKHLMLSRLDSLAPLHRRALRLAAVFGNRFELALLREALGDPAYEPQAAGRNCLVRPAGAGHYVFVHDLVMHCIYDSIAVPQLRQLHRVVAQAYRGRDPALCALHLYRADDPGALDMMLGAIRGKLAGHEFAAALELAAACHAADSTSYSSFALALLRADATAGLGQLAAARLCYQQARQLAGRPQDKIDAVVGLATTLNILEELDEEERLLDETLPLALAVGADAALGKLLYLKGNIYFPRGNFAECRRYHEDAARYAHASAMTETQARALSGVGDSYYAQGRMRKANDLFGECIAMCEQHSLLHIEASNRSALGSTRIYLGQPEHATRDALASAGIARQVGNRRAQTVSHMTAGWALLAAGDLAGADEQIGSGLELARSLGASRFEPFLMESQARLSWQRGDQALAERQIVAVAADVERMQLRGFIGPWVLGTLALFTSDPVLRQKALLRGMSYLGKDCLAHNAYRFYVTAAEVALLGGDLVAADFYAEQLADYAAAEPCTWVDHHVALIQRYAAWLAAPGAPLQDELRALQAAGRQYGYGHTMPRLGPVLAEL